MLGKLIKHELRATARTMLPLFAVLSVLSVIAGFSMRQIEFRQDMPAFVEMVLLILFVAFFCAMVATIVMAYVVMISRFYKNLLGDEGYIMLTLPVSAHSHIWAKILVSCLWFIATAILVALLVAVFILIVSGSDIGYILSTMPSFRELFAQFLGYSGHSGMSLAVFIAEVIVVGFVGIAYICLQFYAAMAVGHSFSNRKMLWSIAAFFALNAITSMMGTGLTLLLNLSGHQALAIGRLLTRSGGAMRMTHLMLLGIIVMALVQTAVYYLLTYLPMTKRLNLE